jgi:pimeloyl-ACP methyl ester carboxylesterase
VRGFAVVLLLVMASVAEADTVELKFASGLIGEASYRSGKPGLPAVLLLHGFMQTRNSPPMNRLADALADMGYPVLSPTLSLGVSRRSKSLACEAVHKNTLRDDLQEVDQWISWLVSHGQQKIVLIGHSSGSRGLTDYLSGTPNVKVERAILTSLTPVFVDREQYRKASAEKPPPPGQVLPLRRFTIAYCKNNYVATLPSYLSYADSSGNAVIKQLAKIKVPVDIVIGTNDQVFEPEWTALLMRDSVPVPVTRIEGAGHFFDGEHEFDLSDLVSQILKKSPR